MNQRTAFIIVILGAMIWGTTGTAQTFIPQSVHSLVIGSIRLLMGGVSLLLGLLLFRKMNFHKWPWKSTIIAALSIAIAQYFFFTSVRLTGVAIGTVVALGSAPAFTGVIEWLLTKRLPTKNWLVATGFAVLGSILLFANKEGIMINKSGVLFALVAGSMFAFYTIYSKKVIERKDAVPAVAIIFTMSGLILLPFVFIYGTGDLATTQGIAAISYLGFFTAGLGYVLFSIGLKHVPPSSALTLALAEPLMATLLGVIIVGEKLGLISWMGIGFLLLGILSLTIGSGKARRTALLVNKLG